MGPVSERYTFDNFMLHQAMDEFQMKCHNNTTFYLSVYIET